MSQGTKRAAPGRRAIEKIAKKTLGLETLETRNSDSLDFHDVSVWSLREALSLAYMAGRRSAMVRQAVA